MKRATLAVGIVVLAVCAFGQTYPAAPQNQPTPQTQPAAQPGAAQTPQPAAPQGRHALQAKTQPEYDAFNAVGAIKGDPVAMEKAADDFAVKFPDSELTALLYKNVMRAYQTANNADKMLEIGRKVVKLDPDDAEALISVGEVITERTRTTDLDRDEKLEEADKLAKHALDNIDNIAVPEGTTPERLEAYKRFLRAGAYFVMGTSAATREKYADAEANFRKALDADPAQPDPFTVLRLALAIDKEATAMPQGADKQARYAEALKHADRAVQMTQETSGVGKTARNEQARLAILARNGQAAPAAQPTSPSTQQPSTTTNK